MDLVTILILSILVLVVALLYSSVGHGGASGYLAVLSFFVIAPAVMSSTALLLNVLVAGMGSYAFYRAGHFSFRLTWPFVVTSVPAAFIGGLISVSEKAYFFLLAVILLIAAYRMVIVVNGSAPEPDGSRTRLAVAWPVGGGIGLLSGIVGVGGGIFLSPLMILRKWAGAKQTAAVSAVFIVVNSMAGLGGRLVRGGLEFGSLWPLVVAAFAGGWVGSHLGARRFSSLTLRRLLAVVLVIASGKLLLKTFS
ncbi:MAG: sulfite exporter TauE/SafE family protein [Ignavibacteria bacterium]|nr:sulfite exporter TauE/SafE family protein [Ignavibacteria bacterium]